VVLTPIALREGDSAFESGNYAGAARSYELYLQSNPKSEDLDFIVFKFGVSQSLSGIVAREVASREDFNRLIREFPKSAWVAPARMILSLQAEKERLQADSIRLQAETERLQTSQKTGDETIKQLNDELDRSHADTAGLKTEIAQLQADRKSRDDKIKLLTDELDKIKKIDLDGRRGR